jgi:metallo-beta-lactamase family protein
MPKEDSKSVVKKVVSRWDSLQTHAVGGKGNIRVTCFGGAEAVTGSNFLIEYQDRKSNNKTIKILLDCGMPQGVDAEHKQWEDFLYEPSEVDFLFVTHAHMDHIGRIPFLKNKGFKGKIFSTKPTRDIAYLSLSDAYHILSKDVEKGKLEKFPYKERDIESSMSVWKTGNYREKIFLDKNISATMFNSSHVLGSCFVQFDFGGEKVLFTGDMGKNSLLLPEADIPTDSEVVFMETVYGSRAHENIFERKERLLQAVKDEISRKGTLVIAAFAIERTQEVLKEINDFIEEKKIPKIPVYLDSPLAIDITKVFKKYESFFNLEMQRHIKHGDDIFRFKGLHFSDTREDSMAINHVPGPKVIIAGSGMVAGGRIIHHVRQHLNNPNSTILLAGYQAVGTYGRLLAEGKKHIIFYGEPYDVRAQIKQLTGYSAHRDQEGLLEFVGKIKNSCKSLNLILGDNESLMAFRDAVYGRFGIRAHICLKKEVLEF